MTAKRRDPAGRARETVTMTPDPFAAMADATRVLAQLRHLYAQMLDGRVARTDEAARGLLGPSVEALERALDEFRSLDAKAYERGRRDGLEGAAKELEDDACIYDDGRTSGRPDDPVPGWRINSAMAAACRSAARTIRALTSADEGEGKGEKED